MKIAIVKLSALGDIIHTQVVLQFIKQQRPDIVIDWVVESAFKDLLAHNPDINQIHCVNLKPAKLQKSLRLLWLELKKIKQFGQYDIVIDAQGLLKSAIVAKRLNGQKIVGFDKNSIRESIASWFYGEKVSSPYAKNIVLRNLDLINKSLPVQILAADILQKKPFLYNRNSQQFFCLSTTQKNILLIIGASFACKKYPVENYVKLTQQLEANFVVLWGSNAEHQQAKKMAKLSPKIKISPQLSLNELKDLITQVDLVIGGDTGPVHMAWALNKPSITLFGATPGRRNSYQTDINIIFESNSPVFANKIDKNDFSIADIDSQDIAKAASLLLGL